MAKKQARQMTTTLDVLTADGVSLPRPNELADDQIRDKLWEAIHGLAARGIYLEYTNHLSDRQLYEFLWENVLLDEQQETGPATAEIVDLVSTGDPEGLLAYIKYYAEDWEREGWSPDDLPGNLDELPPHEDPPFDRDDQLPEMDFRLDGQLRSGPAA